MVSPRFLGRGNDADASGSTRQSDGRAGDDDPDWWELFAGDVADPTDGDMWRRRSALAAAAAVASVVVAGAAVAVSSSIGRVADETPPAATAASAEQAADATAREQLLHRLPRGYDPTTCTATAAQEDAVAGVRCGPSVDPSGPSAATFVADRDETALAKRFDESMRQLRIVDCPGGIQSPGPWHRSATPQQDEGVVVCGYRDGVATVVWTKVADLMVNSVAAEAPVVPAAESLDRIYRWWSAQ